MDNKPLMVWSGDIHYSGRIIRKDFLPTDQWQFADLQRDLKQFLSDRGYAMEGELKLREYGK